jgi:bifunctional ADP-heptose synthase (sugar kinase/adenylyltransferase)
MTASEILAAIPALSTLVVGDLCLDRWCTYDPQTAEPSRETGIARVGVVSTKSTPGAAGTVASNLVSLGVSRVTVLGAIGEDGHGFELLQALATRGISAELSVKSPLFSTFTYTKLLNAETGIEDMPRIDYIRTRPVSEEVEEQLLDRLESYIKDFDVVLVSDQAETHQGGVVTPAMRDSLAKLAVEFPGKVFWADSRMRAEHFRNVIVKPNRAEAEGACTRQFGTVDFRQLRRHANAPFVLVTDGPNGVIVVQEGGETRVRTRPEPNPVDICGAGDSFSAALPTIPWRRPVSGTWWHPSRS